MPNFSLAIGGAITVPSASTNWFTHRDHDWLGEALRPFTTPNWDGENARPVAGVTIGRARSLLAYVPALVPPPAVAPGIDGSVGMLWDRAAAYVYVDIKAHGACHYYYRASAIAPCEDVITAPFDAWRIMQQLLRPFEQLAVAARRSLEEVARGSDPQGGYVVRRYLSEESGSGYAPWQEVVSTRQAWMRSESAGSSADAYVRELQPG